MASPDIQIPPFEDTAIDEIAAKCARVAATFRTGVTKDVAWRKVQLRKLYWALVDYTPQLLEALRLDLNKCAFESMLTELDWVKNDCLFLLGQLDRMAADEKMGSPDVPLAFAAAGLRVRKEPLGAVLVIGAYNYPVQLALGPLVGALAAGCTAVVKPSEVAPATAMVMRALVEARLDPDAVAVVNGGVPETTALLDFRDAPAHGQTGEERGWAKILYTGNRQVARIVAAKAAATLTPVLLELGGRNPAIVTARAPDVRLAARRLLWGKTMNAGQVCISHNYVLVERAVLDAFVAGLQAAFAETFAHQASVRGSELAHIANARHYARLEKMLADSRGRVVMGGERDPAALLMAPTAVLVDDIDDAMIQQESFGPLFAILPVDSVDEAIRLANAVDPTPLALFAFGSRAENERILRAIHSGGATVNDSFLHGAINTIPFGGVGQSGTGAYRGRASFEAFTHRRSVAETPGWMERFLRVRYMPYDWRQLRLLGLLDPRPNFDRDGAVVRGFGYWLRLVFGLGGRGKGAFLRWCGLGAVLLAVLGGRDPGLWQLISRKTAP